MASRWPRPPVSLSTQGDTGRNGGFEREGDKMYLAAEVLQGHYGKETDIFSFGMIMLETAANIVVPAQGDLWHKLREEDFSPVDEFEEECSDELVQLIKAMMRKDPSRRPSARAVHEHRVVAKARAKMAAGLAALRTVRDERAESLFRFSPLAGVEEGFLEDILGSGTGAVLRAL